ncbi:hypothetical protein ACRTEC_04555 [Janibacter indicus]
MISAAIVTAVSSGVRAARAKLDERLFAHNPRRKQEIMAELNELSDRWAELAAELAAAED